MVNIITCREIYRKVQRLFIELFKLYISCDHPSNKYIQIHDFQTKFICTGPGPFDFELKNPSDQKTIKELSWISSWSRKFEQTLAPYIKNVELDAVLSRQLKIIPFPYRMKSLSHPDFPITIFGPGQHFEKFLIIIL